MNPRNTQTRLEDILKALGNIYDVRSLLTKYPHIDEHLREFAQEIAKNLEN